MTTGPKPLVYVDRWGLWSRNFGFSNSLYDPSSSLTTWGDRAVTITGIAPKIDHQRNLAKMVTYRSIGLFHQESDRHGPTRSARHFGPR